MQREKTPNTRRGSRRYALYMLYWYTRTDTDAEREDAKHTQRQPQVRTFLALLYLLVHKYRY
jgi:hypothetical protein